MRISAAADAPAGPARTDLPRLAGTGPAPEEEEELIDDRGTPMIEARGLTKRFGDKLAVDQLSFAVEPGRITGFLGPNGAGKTTTMRLILGLDRPTGGSVTVNGREFPHSARPMREVG